MMMIVMECVCVCGQLYLSCWVCALYASLCKKKETPFLITCASLHCVKTPLRNVNFNLGMCVYICTARWFPSVISVRYSQDKKMFDPHVLFDLWCVVYLSITSFVWPNMRSKSTQRVFFIEWAWSISELCTLFLRHEVCTWIVCSGEPPHSSSNCSRKVMGKNSPTIGMVDGKILI